MKQMPSCPVRRTVLKATSGTTLSLHKMWWTRAPSSPLRSDRFFRFRTYGIKSGTALQTIFLHHVVGRTSCKLLFWETYAPWFPHLFESGRRGGRKIEACKRRDFICSAPTRGHVARRDRIVDVEVRDTPLPNLVCKAHVTPRRGPLIVSCPPLATLSTHPSELLLFHSLPIVISVTSFRCLSVPHLPFVVCTPFTRGSSFSLLRLDVVRPPHRSTSGCGVKDPT